MENQNMGTPDRSAQGLWSDGSFHSLISLEDFKEILGIDDRDDACYPAGSLSRYCLVTATYSMEQYCRRRLLISKQTEIHEYSDDPFVPLNQYPVRKILIVQKYKSWKPAEDIDLVDRGVITGKKYVPPKKPYCGDGWELILTLRLTVEGMTV
jgi:hypothetical protein